LAQPYTDFDFGFVVWRYYHEHPLCPQLAAALTQWVGGSPEQQAMAWHWSEALFVLNVYAGAFVISAGVAWLLVGTTVWLRDRWRRRR
jgi:hypothetical protein